MRRRSGQPQAPRTQPREQVVITQFEQRSPEEPERQNAAPLAVQSRSRVSSMQAAKALPQSTRRSVHEHPLASLRLQTQFCLKSIVEAEPGSQAGPFASRQSTRVVLTVHPADGSQSASKLR